MPPGLIRAITRALQIAPIDLAVLITGESGAGKEFFPQIIHANSSRKHGKYIAVNCGAIPEGTIDSELFGHEKGAFTGALSARKGYFEEADGGTIFLDEVGELPLTTQARLLRVLESGEFLKVGSSTVLKTNVRIVAATNLDMVKAVSEGKFREDLYYRLSTIHIEIPPLRERADDILLLFRKFSTDFAERYRMPVIQLTDDARNVLLNYRWPGNVRQLKNITEQTLHLRDQPRGRRRHPAGLSAPVQHREAARPLRQPLPASKTAPSSRRSARCSTRRSSRCRRSWPTCTPRSRSSPRPLNRDRQQRFTPSAPIGDRGPLHGTRSHVTTAVSPSTSRRSKGKTIDETEGEVIPNEAEYVEEQPTTLEDTEQRDHPQGARCATTGSARRRPRS